MNWIAFSHGAMLCASLIVTIGAQNAFILRQGIMRSHVGKIVLLCTLSDMLLIGAGVGGASVLVERYPAFVHAVLYVGLAYLAWFGLSALRRAFKPGHETLDATGAVAAPPAQRAWPIVLMTLAFTWLNPHVYLDTFLLIGTAGARAGRRAQRVRDRRDGGQRGMVRRARIRRAIARAMVQARARVARARRRDRRHGAVSRGGAVALTRRMRVGGADAI